jgi:hypothetical protein
MWKLCRPTYFNYVTKTGIFQHLWHTRGPKRHQKWCSESHRFSKETEGGLQDIFQSTNERAAAERMRAQKMRNFVTWAQSSYCVGVDWHHISFEESSLGFNHCVSGDATTLFYSLIMTKMRRNNGLNICKNCTWTRGATIDILAQSIFAARVLLRASPHALRFYGVERDFKKCGKYKISFVNLSLQFVQKWNDQSQRRKLKQ